MEYLAPLVALRGKIGKVSVIQSPEVEKYVGLQKALGEIKGLLAEDIKTSCVPVSTKGFFAEDHISPCSEPHGSGF